jgi:hypothetical protein
VVIEKPFGRDLDSCNELLATLADQFEEHNLYRVRNRRRRRWWRDWLCFSSALTVCVVIY